MKVEMKLRGIDGVIDTLRSLPPELVSKRGGPVLASLRKGARIIQAAEKANLRAVTANATTEDDRESTGLLMSSVIVSRGKPPTGGNGERVLVRVKRKTYQGRTGKPVTTLKSAHLLEYGSEKQPAEPWIRPAFNAKAPEAIYAIESEMLRRINRIVSTLAAKNKGR